MLITRMHDHNVQHALMQHALTHSATFLHHFQHKAHRSGRLSNRSWNPYVEYGSHFICWIPGTTKLGFMWLVDMLGIASWRCHAQVHRQGRWNLLLSCTIILARCSFWFSVMSWKHMYSLGSPNSICFLRKRMLLIRFSVTAISTLEGIRSRVFNPWSRLAKEYWESSRLDWCAIEVFVFLSDILQDDLPVSKQLWCRWIGRWT